MDSTSWLEHPFEDEEIFSALRLRATDKVPGPDDFSSRFFIDNWGLIGNDILQAIKSFFKTRKILEEINATHICLIPKSPNEDRVSDFRPISLCNTIYKIISKCLAERLKNFLPELVSNNQTAFIKLRKY